MVGFGLFYFLSFFWNNETQPNSPQDWVSAATKSSARIWKLKNKSHHLVRQTVIPATTIIQTKHLEYDHIPKSMKVGELRLGDAWPVPVLPQLLTAEVALAPSCMTGPWLHGCEVFSLELFLILAMGVICPSLGLPWVGGNVSLGGESGPCLFKAFWAAMIFWRSVMRAHFSHGHCFQRHWPAWPLTGTTNPWFRQREHLGARRDWATSSTSITVVSGQYWRGVSK